jgi:hypothetical protein
MNKSIRIALSVLNNNGSTDGFIRRSVIIGNDAIE